MPVGTSLGEGIGLQEPRRDDSWMKMLARENAARDEAERKRKASVDQAIKESDFKYDHKAFLPPYAKAIIDLESKMYSELAAMRQGDRNLSEYAVRQKALEYRQKMNSYVTGNEAAKAWLKKGDIIKDDEIAMRLNSTDATFDELSKLTERNPFIRISPVGDFAAAEIPSKRTEYKYGEPDIKRIERVGKSGRVTMDQEVFEYGQPSVEKAMVEIASDPNSRLQTMYRLQQKDRVAYGKDPNENLNQYLERMTPVLTEEAQKEAERLKPLKYYGRTLTQTAPAPSGGGGSGKGKFTADVQENIAATILDNEGNPTETVRPLYQPLNPASKPITVSANKGVINANTNKTLKGSYNFSFKPDGVVVIAKNVTDDKGKVTKIKYEKYVMGTTVKPMSSGDFYDTEIDIVEPDPKTGKEVQQKTSKVMIPYDLVSAKIEAENELGQFNERFGKLGQPKAKSTATTQPATIRVSVDGSIGEIPADQWEAFKKKYKNATKVQ